MGPARTAAIAALLLAGLAPAPAAAQDDTPADPGRGSPSGTIYELPLDAARELAAPRSRRSGSPIRSENGFGSSSAVPGAAGGGTTPQGAGPDAPHDVNPPGSGHPSSQSSGRSGDPQRNGGEDERGATATDADAVAAPADGGDGGGSSLPLAISLIAATVLVGAGAGTAAARSSRRGRR